MPLPQHYATTPCRMCDEPVIIVTTAGGERVSLDKSVPVFVRQPDGEGGAIWAQDTSGEVLVRHRAVCKGSGRH
jgi:hypothetical protein